MDMEVGGSAAVALEDCGSAVVLGGGIGQRFKIALVALGGGSDRRTCDNGIGISVVEAKSLLVQCWRQC